MGIQMMGGNPLESFQTGYNLGNKPNAIGTAILGVMDRYQQKQLMDQELGNKLKLSQWESQNITQPAEIAKEKRQQAWEKEKMTIEGHNKLKEIMLTNNMKQGIKTPPEYKTDLNGAIQAIQQGADKVKVFQRISGKYPHKVSEIKNVLFSEGKPSLADILSNVEALQQ